MPGELTAESVLEKLALLGADLGDVGAALLRRVAADAPHRLQPAVDGLLSGHGLASYDMDLLVHLVEAYYIEEPADGESDSGGLLEDGVRDHRYLGFTVPMSAAYRGPFLAMLRANLRAGIACLNRLLNHAARARVQVLRRPMWGGSTEPEDRYFAELNIAGERRRYVGDGQVWVWYRGTGVGPYPCMSALQALELVCDEYLKAGVRPGVLVRLMLDGCENLAMPALVVGMLVRHLERAGEELDLFLAEPAIWEAEFARTTSHEHSGLAARTEGVVAAERRTWDLRQVSTRLALAASGERVDALRSVGRRLVARAADLQGAAADDELAVDELATVRAWAGSLDRDNYTFTETEQGILIEQSVDADIVARLASANADLARTNHATRIQFRYPERYDHLAKQPTVTLDELLADLPIARDLADNPPAARVGGPYDAPAAVAAAALEARFRDGHDVPDDHLTWAASLLVEVLNNLADQGASEDDYSVFGHGADRAAARALPLLSLPAARDLRRRLIDKGAGSDAIARAGTWITEHAANEARLFLARGSDPLWPTPCDTTSGVCHHVTALTVIEDTARNSLFGPWDPAQQRSSRPRIDGPVAQQLQQAENEQVYVPQLSATIRGAAAAAASTACCRSEATELLTAALVAHRRGMRAHEHGYYHSSDDAIAAARALLIIATTADPSLLLNHIDDYADHPRLLSEFLRALAAAGEETATRAAAARDVWPSVLDHVVEFVASGRCATEDHDYVQWLLDAAIPTPSYEPGYLHREYETEPIVWADPVVLAQQIEPWLPFAAGRYRSVDAVAQLLNQLPAEQQGEVGLPWIERLTMADPQEIANRSFLLPQLLERVRPYAVSPSLRASWHRIVDALTVAGDHRVGELAD